MFISVDISTHSLHIGELIGQEAPSCGGSRGVAWIPMDTPKEETSRCSVCNPITGIIIGIMAEMPVTWD